jgi:hypothetical protein
MDEISLASWTEEHLSCRVARRDDETQAASQPPTPECSSRRMLLRRPPSKSPPRRSAFEMSLSRHALISRSASTRATDNGRQLVLYLAALLIKIARARQRSSCCATRETVRAQVPPAHSRRRIASRNALRELRGSLAVNPRGPINGIADHRSTRPIGRVQGALASIRVAAPPYELHLACYALSLPNSLVPRPRRSYIHPS